MSDSRWYFTEEQLANSPSRKCGINAELELSYRQRASNLIQEMGQRLQVSQLCINTAIVYMHRFYAFHSFTLFHRNSIAAAAFFLAAKVEEQPRKLEHVIKILNICLEKNESTRENYPEQSQELVFNENVLLQTLGFDVAIDHPHTHVVRACQLFNIVTVSRELRQTCYFMASNSLHLTTMCLKYRPTVVAAFCIYIACKWSRWEIPDSSEGKCWYSYVDENVTPDVLKKLTDEYLQILEKSPSKFKSKMKAMTSNGQTGNTTSPAVNIRDEPSTTHHKTPHEKSHHHHHKNSAGGSSSSNNANRKQPPGEPSVNALSSSSSKHPQQGSGQAASANYKNQPIGVAPSSSSHGPRQRPSATSGSTSSQHPPYPGSNNSNDNSGVGQKSVNEDRTSHRQTAQENAIYGSSCLPRPIDPHKARTSATQGSASIGVPTQMQSGQHQPPHQKPTNHEQRHPQLGSSKATIDYHQKNLKHPQSAPSGSVEAHSRSSSSSSHSQSQSSATVKKPSWPQQPQTQQSNLPKTSQSHVQSSHSQPNLSTSSSGNSRNSSQALPSYNESTKQSSLSSSSSQPTAQNDFWFNDKLQETTTRPVSPLRTVKSMFSPSPEHDTYDKRLLMITANATKRNESPKSEKQDRRSSTPNKREKKPDMMNTSSSQKSSQIDRKLLIPKLENSTVPPLIPDPGQMKKRPFAALEDTMGDFSRDSKTRKLETIKSEPTHLTGSMMKQPIETNPDIVKSLLQECYTTSKFDSFGMDSPLDVINPDPTNPPAIIASSYQLQPKTELKDLLVPKQEPRDNGFDEDLHKRNKSKKKKDKHHNKHKKKKSHKSDREDREKPTSLKLILSVDAKSSPESVHTPGGLKIKIPIKDVNKSDLSLGPQPMPPGPLKLKISKEKIGSFNNSGTNLSDGGSSSSSHKEHKKKDKEKDRSKSKSSKHGNNNNNNSEFKDVGLQFQTLPVNKMNSQVMQTSSQQNPHVQNAFDMSTSSSSSMYGNHYQQQQQQQQQQYQQQMHQSGMYNFSQPHSSMMNQQQHQQQQQQFNPFPDMFSHPGMNYPSINNSSNNSNSGKK